ncbi:MAG: hypothetical protein J5706_05415, partial [Elusimicrobiales bacterium]|nr:hypothetical protein [Elusimicrobiales bacterium]
MAAAMHSKGVCIPFAAFMFLALLTECIKSKKSLMTLALCFLIVAAGAVSWSITATKEGRVPVGLTESNSRMIPNMIAGAMGIIHTTEGPIIQAYAEKSDLSKKEIFIKAAKIAWNNPGQVLKAPFLRTFALFREMPFTLAALVLFFLSFLKISTFKKTFVLYMSVFYFFGIYIIMPIEGRYFITSIYLMCCCGGMFLADLYAIAKKIAAKYGFEIKNKPAETENRAYSSFILSACIIPHFFIWLLSILLLVSFPSRQKIADADDYLKIFPENSMLLKYPLRKGYPAAHDIKERLALYEKISNTRKSTNWKLRALKFMAEGQDMENPDYGKISRTYRYPDEEGLAWQDILTDSFRHFGAGNIKSGETYAQAAIISCMLSHGYVRLANVQEQKLSLSLAQENAGRCSDNYAEFVFALPPWHSAVKRNFLDSEAYGLLFEENAKALFEKKQMQDCSECCIEKIDRKFLSKCLETADKSYILTDSWEKIMDDISVTPAITHRFPALERVKEKNKKHETQNPDDIETGIKVLESFYSIFDKEIMDKAKTNP